MVRHSYILLEVIIAIALVTLVGFLLLRAPMKSVQKEWEILVEMEKTRLWNNFLIEFEQKLDEQTIEKFSETRLAKNITDKPLSIVIYGKQFARIMYYVVWYNKHKKNETTYYDVCLQEGEKDKIPRSSTEKTHHFLYKVKTIQNPVSTN
ncbi:MAG: hypothetical protein JSR58_02395 [Verrucomicrobia bacterium]|nr:hypothetical protein [Verrucomicrobiota bacterium]